MTGLQITVTDRATGRVLADLGVGVTVPAPEPAGLPQWEIDLLDEQSRQRTLLDAMAVAFYESHGQLAPCASIEMTTEAAEQIAADVLTHVAPILAAQSAAITDAYAERFRKIRDVCTGFADEVAARMILNILDSALDEALPAATAVERLHHVRQIVDRPAASWSCDGEVMLARAIRQIIVTGQADGAIAARHERHSTMYADLQNLPALWRANADELDAATIPASAKIASGFRQCATSLERVLREGGTR